MQEIERLKRKRIAIAEACGWKDEHRKWEGFDVWTNPKGVTNYGRRDDKYANLPDYLNDLNAIHEAEKMLTGDQCKLYFRTLFDVVGNSLSPMNMVHATAAQRAEAFLRTLGKWKDLG